MAAADWKNDVGKINYDSRTFYCTPESGKACLLIDLKKLLKVDRQLRVARAERLPKAVLSLNHRYSGTCQINNTVSTA